MTPSAALPLRLHRRCLPVFCLVGGLAGCSSTTARVSAPPILPVPAAAATVRPGGVKTAMDRQIRAAVEVRNAVDLGAGDPAARSLRAAVVARPADLEARLQLAARYEELEQTDLAIEHYRLAAERFPGEPAPQLRLARSLHRLGRTADAAHGLESYLSAYAEAPAEAHSWAGILRDSLGHHHAAETHHRRALERASGQAAWLQNNLGQNLALQERENEAEAAFRAALALDPAHEPARNNLAALLTDNPTEAAQVLLATGTGDPATAHSNVAAILIEQGRYEQARKELNLALGYKPDHMAALRNLAVVSGLDGKPARLVPAARPAAGGATARGNLLVRAGRAIARVLTASETRPAGEQPAAKQAASAARKKARKSRAGD